jgi:protein N-lysine methyltransferase METTL21A
MENHSSGNEVYTFFELSEELVAPAQIKAAGVTEVDFDGLLVKPLKLHEDLKHGCGGQLWPAGMVLSKYMIRQCNESLKGKAMFERPSGRLEHNTLTLVVLKLARAVAL